MGNPSRPFSTSSKNHSVTHSAWPADFATSRFDAWTGLFSYSVTFILISIVRHGLLHAGDGHSVHIRNLPLNATVPQLEMEFKNFGPIKPGGIQVISNKVCSTNWHNYFCDNYCFVYWNNVHLSFYQQLGFCFGFVEFQDVSSMQKAIKVWLKSNFEFKLCMIWYPVHARSLQKVQP